CACRTSIYCSSGRYDARGSAQGGCRHGAPRAVSPPAVSVLMAVYNGAPWVADAARSVLAQTLGDLELLVVDDGSSDATRDVLAGVRDPRLRLECRPHEGLTPALNHGLRLARAPLVARLDADDIA